MAAIIRMENVVKTYDMKDSPVYALRGILFSVESGEYVSIMGPSGSGKSTCMNMIGCLDRPTSGLVEIDGRNTASLSKTGLPLYGIGPLALCFSSITCFRP